MKVYYKVMIEVPNMQKMQVKPQKFVGQSIEGLSERLKKEISPFVKEKQKFPDYDWSAFVSKISIKESDQAIKSAVVTIEDPYFIFGDMFIPGLFITIEAGWNMAGGYGEVFVGIIQRVRPSFKLASSTITLECFVGEIKMAIIEESQTLIQAPDEEGEMGADIEQKVSLKDELKAICKRNHLELGEVKTEHDVASDGKNQSIKPGSQTDLQMLFEMSKKYYGIWFVKQGKLYFLDLVYIWKTFKPQMAFVFRKLVSTKEIHEQNVLMAGFVGRGIEVKEGAVEGYQEFLIEEADIIEGRPQKTAKTQASFEGDESENTSVIKAEDIKGAPANIDQYRFEWKKVDEFDDAHPGEGTALMGEFFNRGTIEWDKIKQFFTLVPVEDASAPNDKAVEKAAQGTKPKEVFFEEGLKIKLPFGNWKIRPFGTVKVLGIGRYSGSYYMSSVDSQISAAGFEQTVELLRMKDIPQSNSVRWDTETLGDPWSTIPKSIGRIR